MRNIVEQPAAAAAIDDAHERWSGSGDAWEAITWIIAREPEIGTPLTEPGNIRSFTFDGVSGLGLPTVTVIYEIGEDAIIVHDALFREPVAAESGRA